MWASLFSDGGRILTERLDDHIAVVDLLVPLLNHGFDELDHSQDIIVLVPLL